MNLKIFLAVGVLLIGGCASLPAAIKCSVQTVEVPIMQPIPAPPTVNQPDLPITHLSKQSTDGEVALAYAASITQLRNEIKEFELIVQKYADLAKGNK